MLLVYLGRATSVRCTIASFRTSFIGIKWIIVEHCLHRAGEKFPFSIQKGLLLLLLDVFEVLNRAFLNSHRGLVGLHNEVFFVKLLRIGIVSLGIVVIGREEILLVLFEYVIV